MKIRFFRPFFPARILYPDALFRIRTTEKVVCLTFDDGPHPGSTGRILDTLARYGLKAAFFCTGRSAQEYPDLIKRIREEGHLVGNHGYLHLDGFRRTVRSYILNAETSLMVTSGTLFRPPYGRMRLLQYSGIKKKFRIIMWDLMAYDFDRDFGSERSLEMLKKNVRPGSIVTMHDQPQSTVHEFLERFILFCLRNDYRFDISHLNRWQ